MQKKTFLVVGFLVAGFLGLAGPMLGSLETCKARFEAASKLTQYPTFLGQVKQLVDSGEATDEKVSALKEEWLKGTKRGISELEQIIEDCRREAKSTEDPAESAQLLAVAFEAQLSLDLVSPSDRRHTYADAVAAISSIDRHDQTGAVLPFLVGSAMEEWREDPEMGVHLMERAIEISGRLYGESSVERAEHLATLAYLYSPSSNNPDEPHVDAARAERLFNEAFTIFEDHPESWSGEGYSQALSSARAFYEAIGREDRAEELMARLDALDGL